MAVALSRALIGDNTPQAVQIIATGLTSGQAYTLRGSAAGTTWIVRGGDSTVVSGTQLILVDTLAPINVPVTYTLTHDSDGVVTSVSALTIPFGRRFLLASLDGSLAATFRWKGSDPRTLSMRSSAFDIPGRDTPAVRYDVPGSDAGQMTVDTADATETAALLALLRTGGIVVRRTDGAVRDVAPVDVLLVQSASNDLAGPDALRRWQLGYRVIGDPQPDVVVVAVNWDDLDAAYVATTFTAFDTEWASPGTQTWDTFDATDWVNH